jgi:shikimate 5-dehydrogenase
MQERRSYFLIGCSLRVRVWGPVLREAFRALGLPHYLQEVDASSGIDVRRVLSAVRGGSVAGALLGSEGAVCALDLCEEADVSARRAGAADTIATGRGGRLTAFNCEVLGMTDQLRARGASPKTAVVLGAGQRAAVALAACEALGVAVVAVTSRSWVSTEALHESERAETLRSLRALTALWPSAPAAAPSTHFSEVMRLQFADLAASADLVVQATPATMLDGSLSRDLLAAVPWDRLKPDALVCDLVFRKGPGPFLDEARARGLATLSGIEMVSRQASRAVEIWTGLRPRLDALQTAAERAAVELGG